ncbi:hypothetical protein C2I28_26930 (plasmid) [Priestia megaterium]|uniref:HEPN domain-containing protein n=1 Tax=Priestia megaterium TaxID=1404 RepID=UPI000D3EAD83|nr:HEPN domain-containing protein [Priestia megaterium]AWD68665.1 hypothetical protein C2I28_26930 [Priestia megaterium]
MNKNKFKQLLLDTLKDLRENNINDFYTHRSYKVIHTCTIDKSLLEINSFVKGLEAFLKEKSLNYNLAKKTIVIRYMNILKQLLDTETPSQLVTELLEGLEQEISIKQEFKVYVPLRGIELFDNQTFYINSNSRILYLDEMKASELMPDKEIQEFIPNSIEYTINISDFLKAIEIAVESSRLIVHFLRFVDYQGWDEELLGLRLPGYGAQMEELRVIAVPVKAETFSSYNWRLKEARDEALEVDGSFIEDAKDVGLERFGEILNKFMLNSLNDMEVQILRSIVWFGESKIEHDNAARFLKLTLVLECLLNLSKSEPVTVSLSERVAFILETSLVERLKIVNEVQKLYDVRSQIVHNGSSEVEEKALGELEYIVSRIITLFLTNPEYSILKTKTELKSKVNNIKYSG